MFTVEKLIVDNRVFLLGLDHLYREAMKEHEGAELFKCAEEVAKKLKEPPADVPIEGYYTESPELTRYFRLMRALQKVKIGREPEVIKLKSYNRLKQVTSSPIFGPSAMSDFMFPGGEDALSDALRITYPDWNIKHLVETAYNIAIDSDDHALVTLAVLAKDPVVITACRETVVLYAEAVFGCAGGFPPRYKYVWHVDKVIEKRARLFVSTFNKLMGESLPKPCAGKAKQYYLASEESSIDGRCVRIGFDDSKPVRHYHWAIDRRRGDCQVTDFWDTELWTTQRYQEKLESEI